MSIQNTYINAFNLIPGIGPAKLYLLRKHFSNFEKAWNASESELEKAKLPPKLIESIVSERKKSILNRKI